MSETKQDVNKKEIVGKDKDTKKDNITTEFDVIEETGINFDSINEKDIVDANIKSESSKEKKNKKIKVFAYTDGPMVMSGFGVVNNNIFKYLLSTGKYEIHCLAINYYGDPHPLQGTKDLYIYPMQGDPYGRNRLFPLLMQIQPDVMYILNDYDAVTFLPQILMEYKQRTSKTLPVLLYFPVDGYPFYPEYVEFLKKYIDKPVVVSKFGKEMIKKADPTFEIDQVYHGVDTNSFKKLDDKVVAKLKGDLGNKFLILAVGVNQLRKQYPILLEAFAEFAKDKDDVALYLHTQRNLTVGWDLDKLVRLFNLTDKVLFTNNLVGLKGVETEALNLLYNVADVFVSSAAGEGYGLPLVEAMATGLPIIYPDNTSMPEVVGDAGIKIPTDHYTIFPNKDRELIRPIPSVKHMVNALNEVYSNDKKRKEMSKKSLAMIKKRVASGDFDWNKIGDYFDKELTALYENKDVETLDLEEIL